MLENSSSKQAQSWEFPVGRLTSSIPGGNLTLGGVVIDMGKINLDTGQVEVKFPMKLAEHRNWFVYLRDEWGHGRNIGL